MPGVLLQLLAADPRTPGPTLTWLAGRADLTQQAFIAVVANPHLPVDAPLHLPADIARIGQGGALLTAALADPRVSAERRSQILAFAPAAVVARAIAAGAPLTTADVAAQHSAHPPTTLAEHVSYLTHPATPTHLAATSIAAATDLVRGEGGDLYIELLIEAATVRHATGAATPRALAALLAPDPGRAYALALASPDLARAPSHDLAAHYLAPARNGGWWEGAILEAHPHPALIAELLTSARAGDQSAARAAAAAERLPDADRLAALILTERGHYGRVEAARTCADRDIPAVATSYAARLTALTNPHASATTLERLYYHLTVEDAGDRARTHALRATPWNESPGPLLATTCEALATHPNLSADLRGELITHDHDHALSRHLHRSTAPGDLLEAPWVAVRSRPAQDHALHWAARAYATYSHADVRAEHAHALLALGDSDFTGTFRELLDTARAIST